MTAKSLDMKASRPQHPRMVPVRKVLILVPVWGSMDPSEVDILSFFFLISK